MQEDFVSTWTTAHKKNQQWSSFIEVGSGRSYIPTGGGIGTVVIDLVPDNVVKQEGTINLGVSVGSDDKGTYKIIGTDYIVIPIMISNNGG